MNRKKLEIINDLLKVKSKIPYESYTLDCTHKRLNALPKYEGLNDVHLSRHFLKRGIYANLTRTGLVDRYGKVRPKKINGPNYEDA